MAANNYKQLRPVEPWPEIRGYDWDSVVGMDVPDKDVPDNPDRDSLTQGYVAMGDLDAPVGNQDWETGHTAKLTNRSKR